MDAKEFLENSLRPTLIEMDSMPNSTEIDMYSLAAEKLLLMTACHESGGFEYRHQQGGGPALSYFQMEPSTLNDLYKNYLSYHPDLRDMLDSYLPEGMSPEEALEKVDAYACAATRLQYSRFSEALPEASDDWAMAGYCKKYWNTDAGKATQQKYYDDWQTYKPDGYPDCLPDEPPGFIPGSEDYSYEGYITEEQAMKLEQDTIAYENHLQKEIERFRLYTLPTVNEQRKNHEDTENYNDSVSTEKQEAELEGRTREYEKRNLDRSEEFLERAQEESTEYRENKEQTKIQRIKSPANPSRKPKSTPRKQGKSGKRT